MIRIKRASNVPNYFVKLCPTVKGAFNKPNKETISFNYHHTELAIRNVQKTLFAIQITGIHTPPCVIFYQLYSTILL